MLPAIGYAIREQNQPAFDDAAVNALELKVDPQDAGDSRQPAIRSSNFEVVSLRALQLAVAAGETPSRSALDRLKELAQRNGAGGLSDQLALKPAGPQDAKGPAAVATLDHSLLDAACRNIDAVHRGLGGTRFYIENMAYAAAPQGPLSEADFLGRVLQKTGCGWLLDVANVYANGRRFGYDAYDFVAEVMPCATHVQMRLCGGFFDERARAYVKDSAHAIPDEVWSLYRHALLLGGHKTDAVFIEFGSHPQHAESHRNDVRHARFIAERVHGRQRMMRTRLIARRA